MPASSASGGARLFHMLSKLYDRTSAIITPNRSVSEWATVFGDAKMTTALRDRPPYRCHILKTANDSFRFNASSDTQPAVNRSIPSLEIDAPGFLNPCDRDGF